MNARAAIDRIATAHVPWWLYNGGLVLLGLASFGAAAWLQPGDDAFVHWRDGSRFGELCGFLEATGLPCPQCGMTRSWVYGAHGQLWTGFLHNPAGLGLFLWIQVGAVIGAVRLVRRDPDALTPPWQVVIGWTFFWLIALYVLPYLARLAGLNPLPG